MRAWAIYAVLGIFVIGTIGSTQDAFAATFNISNTPTGGDCTSIFGGTWDSSLRMCTFFGGILLFPGDVLNIDPNITVRSFAGGTNFGTINNDGTFIETRFMNNFREINNSCTGTWDLTVGLLFNRGIFNNFGTILNPGIIGTPPIDRTSECNTSPDCNNASSSLGIIWPPNHKMVSVTVDGITDPDGDPVTINIDGITQDEPTNGLGDGDQSPDGAGVGTDTAQVRAERSGLGDGRVYAISFTADDGNGGTCTGTVNVGVPHDVKDNPFDSGQVHDSTS